jgi:Tat protein translocase TatB subunit
VEIFGIGLGELLIIAVVALIVLGPERLPEAARALGKGISDFRKAVEPARAAWRDLSTSLTETVTTATNPWTVHPILEKMTPEEREKYMAGGEMPARVIAELEELDRVTLNGHAEQETSDLVYPMPHSTIEHEAAPPLAAAAEELEYPEPGGSSPRE